MIKPNEAEEFDAGWYDAPAAPGEAEQDEFDRLIASAPTAADRLAAGEGEQYAAAFNGDGVMSTQEHQRYLEATGSYIDGSTPEKAAPAPAAAYSAGKDSEMTLGVKQRNYDANQGKYIQQFMDHGFSRKQAEAEVARRRP